MAGIILEMSLWAGVEIGAVIKATSFFIPTLDSLVLKCQEQWSYETWCYLYKMSNVNVVEETIFCIGMYKQWINNAIKDALLQT